MNRLEKLMARVFKYKYPALGFWQNVFGGHLTIGPVTIYGENAMHWAVVIDTRWGYLSFRLPLRCFGAWWSMYCFLSPDATPKRATKWFWGRKARGY